jgi:hypothetical protein
MTNAERPDGQTYSAERTRQGEIVLRSRAARLIFIAGLVGAIVLGFALLVYGPG